LRLFQVSEYFEMSKLLGRTSVESTNSLMVLNPDKAIQSIGATPTMTAAMQAA